MTAIRLPYECKAHLLDCSVPVTSARENAGEAAREAPAMHAWSQNAANFGAIEGSAEVTDTQRDQELEDR